MMIPSRITGDAYVMQNLSCPMVVMRFHLIYSGQLASSGNKAKPGGARSIRDALHPQIKHLWDTHAALKQLRQSAVVLKNPGAYIGVGPDSPLMPMRDLGLYPARDDEVDLCEPLKRGAKTYIPLVRRSLDLNCEIHVLFLRNGDPGALVLPGGEIDNRIKTLVDALRIPDADVEAQYPQAQDPTYCLMENDTLVSDLSISTDRLLTAKTEHDNEVHLVIEVIVRVLRVGSWNIALV
jgi:hypothetical protein